MGYGVGAAKKDENAPALVKTSMAMELQLELADNDEEQV